MIGTRSRRFSHPDLGWSIDLPEGTEAVIDVPPAYLLPHRSRWGFRPAVVITSGPAAPLDEALGQQAAVLDDPLLLDRRPVAHPAGDGEAVVIHHVADGRSLTLTQWWLATGGTCTCCRRPARRPTTTGWPTRSPPRPAASVSAHDGRRLRSRDRDRRAERRRLAGRP